MVFGGIMRLLTLPLLSFKVSHNLTAGAKSLEAAAPTSSNGATATAAGIGRLAGLASGGAIVDSLSDGINRTKRTLPANKDWLSVAYGVCKFVEVSFGSARAVVTHSYRIIFSISNIASV
jgi:hypothetical protein